MSLKIQLFFTITILSLLIFIGTFSVSLFYTRHYLEDQLRSNAMDTATSLGISISTVMRQNDKQEMLTIVQAVFDHGYYTKIAITDLQGKVLVARTRPIRVNEVPQWFIALFPLNSPTASADIMSGWHRMGAAEVTAHTGYAYLQLWQIFWGLLTAFVLISIILCCFALLIIRKILRPLKKIEQQATNICEGSFTTQEEIPRAKELKSVMLAMNKMSLKIKNMVQHQTDEIQRLNHDVYIDPLTSLYTRKYFYEALDDLITDSNIFVNATVVIIGVHGLKTIKKNQGFPLFSETLNQLALIIKKYCPDNSTRARLTSHNFALLLINQDPNIIIKKLIKQFKLLSDQLTSKEIFLSFHMGAWQFQQAKSVFEIMSAADNSLRQAEQNTKAFVLLSDIDKTTEIRSASEWQNILVHAIKHDLFVLYFQPIKSAKSEVILHYEVFLRIKTLEKDMTGKWFSPYAELFGKATVLDKIIIEKITDFIKSSPNTHYAISLSNQSLNDSDFAAWLSQYLQAHPELSNRLLLETTETNVLNSLPQTKQLQHILKSFHIKFGIDKFAHSVSNFDYLQEIIPDYIKFSELFSEDIVEDKKNQFSIKSIIQLAHDLDCMAIACNIETQNQQDTLRELNVDALQGDWIGKPEIHTL